MEEDVTKFKNYKDMIKKKQLDLCRKAFTFNKNLDKFVYDTMLELCYSFNIDDTMIISNEFFKQNFSLKYCKIYNFHDMTEKTF